MSLTRRVFIKQSGLAIVAFAAVPSFLKRAVLANKRAGRRLLIAVFQRGAADGISMVVPFADTHYYAMRPQIAIPAPKSGDPDAALDLDGRFGLHPALAPLKPLYDAGLLAIVHAVGSPHNTRSHFDAQDFMETATPGIKSTQDGWLNRYLQARPDPQASPFRAVALSATLPRSLMGEASALAMPSLDNFGLRGHARDFESLYALAEDPFRTAGKEAFEALTLEKRANPQRYQPSAGANYPRTPFGQALRQIVQLIKADVGLEVAFADIGGWDTHANQGASRGQLANRLQEFGQALAALARDLGDKIEDVVLLTMTEFGRTIRQNGSGGTDHGHASCLFVLGGPVRGGRVYGRWPGLAPEQLFEGRDLALTTDFRDVFAEVAARHMGASDLKKIFPGYNPDPNRFLGFIKS
jgi:uncharacterized protein (DUF1501 family)